MKKILPHFMILILGIAACGGKEGNPLVDDPQPTAPTLQQPELLPDGIQLSWSRVEGASNYEIFRQPHTTSDGLVEDTTELSWQDRTANAAGTEYTYWVRAVGPGPNGEAGQGVIGKNSQRLSVTFQTPAFEVSPNPGKPLDFGIDVPELPITLKNRGGGTIVWNISADKSWVTFETPENRQVDNKTPQTVRLTVDRSLPPGTDSATVTFSGKLNPPLPVAIAPVTFTVQMEILSEPVLSVKIKAESNSTPPDQLSLELCPGESAEIEIRNTGKGRLDWEILGFATWLEVIPRDAGDEGLDSNEHENVRLQVLETDAAPGDDSVALRVVGASQQKTVVVTRHIPEPELEIVPNSDTLTAANRWRAEVELKNIGACSVFWEAAPTQNWLVAEPMRSGEIPRDDSRRITLRPTVDSLERGKPSSLDAGEHPVTVSFTQRGNHRVSFTLIRKGILRGEFVDIFPPRRGIAGVMVTVPGVGTGVTDRAGRFELNYDREQTFTWTAKHPDFLTVRGSVSSRGALGELNRGQPIALIPIPKSVGHVRPDVNRFDVPWGVVLSDDGRRAFVTQRDGGTVSIIDAQSLRVEHTVVLGKRVLGAAFSEGQLFVASPENTLFFINPQRPEQVSAVEMLGSPAYLAACGGKLAVTLQDARAGNRVAVMNVRTRRVERRVGVGQMPFGIAADPRCRWFFVANNDLRNLSRIDIAGGGERLFDVGRKPQGVAVSPDGRHVYTADAETITRLNIETHGTTEFTRNARFGWVAVVQLPGAGGDLVYATDERLGADRVWMWHPASNEFATIPVGGHPFGIAATPDGRRVFVCNAGDNTVEVLENR